MLNATSVLRGSGKTSADAFVDPTDYLLLAYNASTSFIEFQSLLDAPTEQVMEYVMIRAMVNKELAKGKTKK